MVTKKLTDKKSKKITKEELINSYTVPFKWTKNNPFELNSVSDDDPRPCLKDILDNIPSLEEYFKTRKSAITYNGWHLVYLDLDYNEEGRFSDKYPVVTNFECVIINPESNYAIPFNHVPRNYELTTDAEIYIDDYNINSKKFDCIWFSEKEINPFDFVNKYIPMGLCLSNVLLINADEEATLSSDCCFSANPSNKAIHVSFRCLANLINKKVTQDLTTLSEHKIRVISYTNSIVKPVSKKIENNLNLYRKNIAQKGLTFSFRTWASQFTPPEPGFSLVESFGTLSWHKPPTILIANGKNTCLLGQDEGSYFGCILPTNPKTIKEAYLSLVPSKAKKAKGVIRQGEWFAIPVKADEVPNLFSDKVLLYINSNEGSIEGVCLQRDSQESNRHFFYQGIVIITKKGIYATNFVIQHNEHEPIIGEKDVWYTFAKNTAKMSFSVENVD